MTDGRVARRAAATGCGELDRVVVAFSGGADSAFLAWVAHDTLGADRALAVTAVSPSLAGDERATAPTLAAEWGLRWQEVDTDEMAEAAYRAQRRRPLLLVQGRADGRGLAPLAAERRRTVVLGVNVDDLGDHRPGQRAAAERGAAFPLVDAGFTKADVRVVVPAPRPAHVGQAGRRLPGLPPALRHAGDARPCCGRVERAEAGLRALGFADLRVRHYGDLARLEVPLDRLADVVAAPGRGRGRACGPPGYRYVTLDLEGLRSGNLNAALELRPDGPPSATGVQVGKAMWSTPEVLDQPALGGQLGQAAAGPLAVADHHGVLGHAEQQRADSASASPGRSRASTSSVGRQGAGSTQTQW